MSIMLYMSTRTQIYLTDGQRLALDERAAREGRTLADLIREAVDQFLATRTSRQEALKSTLGTHPEFEIPDRNEWDPG
ncbi:MAG: ribbon-helix-helix protein, CopG family [Acidimicrobiia bacterium]|nr:ribbon-helix-helix domain-containing protein [Acidimicrobiia bacterium]MBT8246506.1 ribbon-helix-helix domain-containing protein [Acidimicrobiia bacterium]NNF89348.1 ribbon-helix-helix protein, CopG family [Acidimicrobiia bacterium]NNJ47157.1 ribbon-helix-helix protein, CopG family [Acidimicrobiia bacterium]NNL13640.1 ribbon-helix-helix protein, CopG family [Acidimicrobiia bacterium]